MCFFILGFQVAVTTKITVPYLSNVSRCFECWVGANNAKQKKKFLPGIYAQNIGLVRTIPPSPPPTLNPIASWTVFFFLNGSDINILPFYCRTVYLIWSTHSPGVIYRKQLSTKDKNVCL